MEEEEREGQEVVGAVEDPGKGEHLTLFILGLGRTIDMEGGRGVQKYIEGIFQALSGWTLHASPAL